MKLTLAFAVTCQRQKYMRSVLDSWSHVRGIEDVSMIFSCEPNPQAFPMGEFRDYLIRTFPKTPWSISVNDTRLWCLGNVRKVLDLAFRDGADFAVAADEDVAVSADVLEYYTWASARYQDDEQVTAVCAHSFNCSPKATKDEVTRIDWFSPIGWGTWKDRWEQFIKPEWHGIPGNQDAWDTNLRYQTIREGKVSIFPVRSRTLHLGEFSTITPGALMNYFYKGSVSATFNPDHGQREYREVPRTPDLGLIV